MAKYWEYNDKNWVKTRLLVRKLLIFMIFHSISANRLIFCQRGGGPRILVKYSPVLKSVKILMKRVYIIYISGLNGFRNTFVILIKGHSWFGLVWHGGWPISEALVDQFRPKLHHMWRFLIQGVPKKSEIYFYYYM